MPTLDLPRMAARTAKTDDSPGAGGTMQMPSRLVVASMLTMQITSSLA